MIDVGQYYESPDSNDIYRIEEINYHLRTVKVVRVCFSEAAVLMEKFIKAIQADNDMITNDRLNVVEFALVDAYDATWVLENKGSLVLSFESFVDSKLTLLENFPPKLTSDNILEFKLQ